MDITGWSCDTFTQDADGNWPLTGDYIFTAEPETGYVLASEAAALEVKVVLDEADTYEQNNTVEAGGIKIVASKDGQVNYTEGSGFTLEKIGDYTISGTWNGSLSGSGGSTQAVITVPSDVTANVTLNGVTIDVSRTSYVCAFLVEEGGTANLNLTGQNMFASGRGYAGIQVGKGAELTMEGSGELEAKGGDCGAGIGGGGYLPGADDKYLSSGTIIINGGKVKAIGGYGGAGIGGGGGELNGSILDGPSGSNGGITTIIGGEVTAIGGRYGAGIGGGSSLSGGSGRITISGGKVTACGGKTDSILDDGYGPGIGDGAGNNDSGVIIIIDGEVIAEGGSAGIGGGSYQDSRGGIVTISGGDTSVEARALGDNGHDVGGNLDGGSLSVTDGATLEMKNKGTNVTTPEYKNCTITDKDGNRVRYDDRGNSMTEWDGQNSVLASALGVQPGGTILITGSNNTGGATLTIDVDNVTVTSNGAGISGINIEAAQLVNALTIHNLTLTAQDTKRAIFFDSNAEATLTVEGSCTITGGADSNAGDHAIAGSGGLTVEVGSASLTAVGGACRSTFIGGYGICADSLNVNVDSGGFV